MNVANITDSRNTATFSARRRSQRAIVTARAIVSGFTDHACVDALARIPVGCAMLAGQFSGDCTGLRSAGVFSLHRVDALQRALRPLAAVFVEIALLREDAESILVWRVNLLAFFLEELDRL